MIPMSQIPKWFEIALNEIGTKEIQGKDHNERIIEYHSTTTLKAQEDEISWCSSFVNWCLKQCGVDHTKSAAARSWEKWGEKIDEPKIGDIVVFRRVDSSWAGHVGFFVAQDKERILVLGGNQSNDVCFQWYKKSGSSLFFYQFRALK